MTFAYTIKGFSYFGNKKVVWGTFTNAGGDTGGDIKTGLNTVDFIQLQHTGSAVVTDVPVPNETFPMSSGDVTIVTVDGADGIWWAQGDA